jgi:hypothetical protein
MAVQVQSPRDGADARILGRCGGEASAYLQGVVDDGTTMADQSRRVTKPMCSRSCAVPMTRGTQLDAAAGRGGVQPCSVVAIMSAGGSWHAVKDAISSVQIFWTCLSRDAVR